MSNTAFHHLMEFTYTATLAVTGDEETYDVWKAAEYLQMQEALKALESNKSVQQSDRKFKCDNSNDVFRMVVAFYIKRVLDFH